MLIYLNSLTTRMVFHLGTLPDVGFEVGLHDRKRPRVVNIGYPTLQNPRDSIGVGTWRDRVTNVCIENQ